METELQQQKKKLQTKVKEEITTLEVRKETGEAKINEMISSYFTWFVKNSIEDVQTVYKFWNQQFIDYHRSWDIAYN